jgi:hypothetical protein
MKGSQNTEKSIEQLFAEVFAPLALAEEVMLPEVEAKIQEVRKICDGAYEALNVLELAVDRLRRKK